MQVVILTRHLGVSLAGQKRAESCRPHGPVDATARDPLAGLLGRLLKLAMRREDRGAGVPGHGALPPSLVRRRASPRCRGSCRLQALREGRQAARPAGRDRVPLCRATAAE